MPEQEIIRHPQIDGLHLFLNTVVYRTPHMHPEWELLLVLDEPLIVAYEQQEYSVTPGQMVLLSPNQPHSFHKVQEGCTFLCLQMAPRCFPSSEHLYIDDIRLEGYLPKQEYRWVRGMMLDLMWVYLDRPAHYELLCTGNANLLLHCLLAHMPVRCMSPDEAGEQAKRNARLERLIKFVDQNYMHKIKLSTFADRENCSMSYLSHFAKTMLNQSFQDYVNTVRFNCACKLIATGNCKMLDVCMESGFSDYRYFSNTFKQKVGMTPEAYSRLAQAPVEDEQKIHHSIHSKECFYSREESLALLGQFEADYR